MRALLTLSFLPKTEIVPVWLALVASHAQAIDDLGGEPLLKRRRLFAGAAQTTTGETWRNALKLLLKEAAADAQAAADAHAPDDTGDDAAAAGQISRKAAQGRAKPRKIKRKPPTKLL